MTGVIVVSGVHEAEIALKVVGSSGGIDGEPLEFESVAAEIVDVASFEGR